MFFTKAKSLEHFFLSHDQILFLFFFDYMIGYDNISFLWWWGVSIILWPFIYLIFQYDMNQNKFFIVIKLKVFLRVHTSSHNISFSS